MDEIFHYSSRAQLDAKENLYKFIEECKFKLTVFGKDLKWTDWKWPRAANFTKIGAHSGTNNTEDALDDEFISFAKAYFRYQQGHHPTGAKNELKALRAVEASLLKCSAKADIQNLSVTVLDEAALIIRNHYSKGAAYHGGRELERLANFISKKHLISIDLSNWKSPILRKMDEIQTGLDAKARREKKLPSEDALNAMAEIFANNPSDSRDIFTSSTFAMLMSAPSRITEVLELPVDCEIEQQDSKKITRYGWRFYSGKGFGANIKWIPTEMSMVAKEAIKRITNDTQEARKLALWIESNPNRFYRHDNCPHVDDDEPLSAIEVCRALGFAADNNRSARSSLFNIQFDTRDGVYTLRTVWKYVLSRQPEGFPWLSKEKKLKYSNALFCMTRNQIGSQRGTSPVILWAPTNNVFNSDLSSRESQSKNNHKSIFDRYSYLNSSKERFKLTSHQARHLLNTMAQRGGLSQSEIAKWSGRADVKQNRTYNHMTEYEMVAKAEQLDTSMSLFGPSGDVGFKPPITIAEFNTLEKIAAHITEFGVCVKDIAMAPCNKYRDCLNCAEHVCIKGDPVKLERIKKRLELVQMQFNEADKALKEGFAGADRWYEYYKDTATHLMELKSILENPAIQDGAQIKLKNDKAFSQIRRAIETKLSESVDENETNFLVDIAKKLKDDLG